jgi:hypothetical protein
MMRPFTSSQNNQGQMSCDVCIELITTPPPHTMGNNAKHQSTQSMIANKTCKSLG